jgi:hypothetical protein
MSTPVLVALALIFFASLIAAATLDRPGKVFGWSVLVSYLVFVIVLGGTSPNSTQSAFAVGWAFVPTIFAIPVCAVAVALGSFARGAVLKYVKRSNGAT